MVYLFLALFLFADCLCVGLGGFEDDELPKKRIKMESLQRLAAKKVAQQLASDDHMQQFVHNPHALTDKLHALSSNASGSIIVEQLLKEYKARIAAQHISPMLTLSHNNVKVLQFSADEKYLAAASHNTPVERGFILDGGVEVWNVDNGKLVLAVRPMPEVDTTALLFNRNKDHLVIGKNNGWIAILNMNAEVWGNLNGHQNKINNLCYNHNETLLASASQDATACIWNMENGQLLHRLDHHIDHGILHPDIIDLPVFKVCFLTDGYVTQTYNAFYEWDEQGRCKRSFYQPCYDSEENYSRGYCSWNDHQTDLPEINSWNDGRCDIRDFHRNVIQRLQQAVRVTVKKFSPDGSCFAVGLANGEIKVYDCPSYKQALASLDVVQALCVLHSLKSKEQSYITSMTKMIASYFCPQSQESKQFFDQVRRSLSDTFKEMVE